MIHSYKITGMTCDGCRESVKNALSKVEGVTDVKVDLEKAEAALTMDRFILLDIFQKALQPKFYIFERTAHSDNIPLLEEKSKWQQLIPLFLVLSGIAITALLLNSTTWKLHSFMLDYMGLFFLVFSFFKLLDLKGFPPTFSMYDPLARVIPLYGWIYPFIEIGLGVMFLTRFNIFIALVATLVVLGITTVGVTSSLLNKRKIKCACLGTVLNLPMTEATFIENAIMIVMAVFMLINLIA